METDEDRDGERKLGDRKGQKKVWNKVIAGGSGEVWREWRRRGGEGEE